ncbi:hypothetical protein [Paramesorhizobium deserti]|nr:hypothetical protein [Paramesorhizobium deserti]
MTSKQVGRQVPKISETTGTDTPQERRKAAPTRKDMRDPKKVWSGAETTPEDEPNGGRVADAGDAGGGQPSPYDEEVQADTVGQQTRRTKEPRGIEKPKQ